MKQVRFSNAMRAAALTGGLFLTASAFGQQVVVKGHVKDATGEPIIGATIRVDGTDGGTITDIDGNFSINADAKSTLKISYIGYETVSVAAGQNINVILKEDAATKLDDVVVIGYGRAKKTDLTGSISALKPDELSKGITNNASDMLVGKVAGVDGADHRRYARCRSTDPYPWWCLSLSQQRSSVCYRRTRYRQQHGDWYE